MAAFKICKKCKKKKIKDKKHFHRSKNRLASVCKDCLSVYRYNKRVKFGYPRRLFAARSGDKKQARMRVRTLVCSGFLPASNDVPCYYCGDTLEFHQYHHYKGYDSENHEIVVSCCRGCHVKDESHLRDRIIEKYWGKIIIPF